MKKQILWCFVLSLFYLSALAQPKKYISIVKPVLYDKTKESFESIAKKFDDANYKDLGEIFRSFANGGHGSGFVFVDEDGENYIITNKHVVVNSENVNLEFIEKGSSKVVYESCPIIYTDDEIDLAVIKFPNNEKIYEKSFKLEIAKQSEGIEIWSAGYPGLLGKPMWQFAKGNITNEEAYIEELIAPEVSYLIQHSASIDPGNSGGPLLIKKQGEIEDYSVIGINTWTVSNRQNTFFSIPASNIPAIIGKAKRISSINNNPDSLKIMLDKQCSLFAAEMNSENPKWSKVDNYISYLYVADKGWESFLKVLTQKNSENTKILEKKFFNYSPIEAMRLAILIRIWEKWDYLKKEKLSIEYKGINIADKDLVNTAKTIRTTYLINGQSHELIWYFEHGHWRISSYDLEKSYGNSNSIGKKKSESDNSFYLGFNLHFVPYTSCRNQTLGKNFNLMGYGGTVTFNFGEKASIYSRVSYLSINNGMKTLPTYLTSASVKFLHFNNGLLIFLGKKEKLKPYLLGGFNYVKFYETGASEFAKVTNIFERTGSQLGLGLKYKFTNTIGMYGEITYNSEFLVPIVFDSSSDEDASLANIQASIGICIDLKKKHSSK